MHTPLPAGTILGHPKGLFLLFGIEMWERFSYYGMRAIMVLTLVAAADGANPGFGMSQGEALRLYSYFSLVWFTPIIGGWLADHHLGQRRSVLIGALIMAGGQFILWAAVPGNLPLFYLGLAGLILGNGFFKANIATMVGMLYRQGDARRDGAFTIFYMGANIGGFLGPLVCAYFGENAAFGWRYGNLAAGCGMTFSAVIQLLLAQRMLGDLGMAPSRTQIQTRDSPPAAPLTRRERDRLRVILMLFIFCVLFWAAFEQQGGLMNLYISEKTDRHLGGFEIPAGWFQSVNAFYVVLLGPVFAALWSWLGGRRRDPSSPLKMAAGLVLAALSFLFMVGATGDQAAHGKANMAWVLLSLLLQTMGELCISPVGLSMTTKLAPARLASLVMGIWYLTNFFGSFFAGQVGALTEHYPERTLFLGFAGALAIFAGLLWLLCGRLVTWMHGAETEGPTAV